MTEHHRIPLTAPLINVRLRPPEVGSPRKEIGPTEDELRIAREQKLQVEIASLKETVETLQYTIEEYEQRRQQSLHELQKMSVELGVMAAAHVAQAEINKDNCGIEVLVAKAIEKLDLLGKAKVRLHPADVSLLKHHMGRSDVPWDGKLITIVEDNSMDRGSVRLDGESGRAAVTDVTTRIDQIRETWRELISVPQNEDRRVPRPDSAMRRFPDRRETA